MHAMDMNQVRQNLESEERRLQQLAEGIREDSELDLTHEESSGEDLSTADQHPADQGTETQAREAGFSMLEQLETELADVERALHKLDDGTYGTCEACGKPIDEARLAALPATRYCVNDQSRAESDVAPLSNGPATTSDNSAPL
jgi:RNA polymerase-binding transcription factor DksA